ncbi:MAG: dihydrolipoyl dehydrogenase [Clostridium sp.]|nr:dihydrolipoyl dehydrogenase [Clostridium sp.]
MKRVVIIGGGPGGYVAAIRLGNLNFDVTLIEKEKIGGVCLNEGCIPTKAIYRSAEILNIAHNLEDYGISMDGNPKPELKRIRERKENIVDTLVGGIEKLVEASQTRVIYGEAKILGKKEISVNGVIMAYDKLIIATGSQTFIPPIKGVGLENVVTSKELLELKTIPDELIIIGGGVIGMEFAGIFNSFGSKITVLEALPSILPNMDGELVKRVKPLLKRQGMNIITSVMVTEIKENNGKLEVTYDTKKGPQTISGDQVLVSTGRRPSVQGFGIEALDIQIEPTGIVVDDNFRTSDPDVFAIGDVNGKWQLAHAASSQGEFVAELIAGETPVIGKVMPGCIFMFPEMASVGKTEEELKLEGIPYLTSKFMLGANGKALTMGETDGLVKVITDENEVIIGVHILGAHASDYIHEGVLACEKSMKVEEFKSVIHAHPTLSEAFYESVMGIKGEAVHMINKNRG